jgi:raffinose/stachyose/melibiose transport system permease protein
MRLVKAEPYLYVLPAGLLLLVFVGYPVVQSFLVALYDWDGLGRPVFTGFANLRKLFLDPVFWKSLKNTAIWVVMSGVILSIGGLFLAFLVEYGASARLLSGISRTVLFIPMMMSLVSIGLLWALIFNPMLGLLTNLLAAVGLASKANPLNLLGNPKVALYFAFIPAIWQWSGFGMVVFSAALQGIPQELYDASSIDGATYARQMRHITLPLLYPAVVIVTTVNVIGAFKAFDLIYVMTAGGPGDATLVSSILIFREAFVVHHFGYASAIAVVLFVITVIITALMLRYRNAVQRT